MPHGLIEVMALVQTAPAFGSHLMEVGEHLRDVPEVVETEATAEFDDCLLPVAGHLTADRQCVPMYCDQMIVCHAEPEDRKAFSLTVERSSCHTCRHNRG